MTANDRVFCFRIDRMNPLTLTLPLLGDDSSSFATDKVGVLEVW
jgi:hypothetical protein